MAGYLEAKTPVKDKKDPNKTYWHKCGTAFTTKQGNIRIILNSLPVNGEIVLFKPGEGGYQQRSSQPRKAYGGGLSNQGESNNSGYDNEY